MGRKYKLIIVIVIAGIITFITYINVNGAVNEQDNVDNAFALSGFVSFLPLLILIGGSILITLSYVSWRKYKASKRNKKIKKRNSNY